MRGIVREIRVHLEDERVVPIECPLEAGEIRGAEAELRLLDG